MKQFGKAKHIHFVGIGGIGMSGIAELLINLGYEVSGSDLRNTAVTKHLGSLGGRIFKGHKKGNVEGADVVVYSSAVGPENPEIIEAKDQYIPAIPRAEMFSGTDAAEIRHRHCGRTWKNYHYVHGRVHPDRRAP